MILVCFLLSVLDKPIDHLFAIIGPLIAHSNGNNELLNSVQIANPKEGWVGNRLAHKAHKIFKATARKLYGFR